MLRDLTTLVEIESVGADPARSSEVRRSAEAVAGLFDDLGCPDVRIISAGGGAPAVLARFPAPEGQPTVCLYAHHDVQPEGDPARWSSAPFTATPVGDRLYGRGTSDDKGGLAVHLAALRAFGGRPPVGVTVFVEGEEELGSPTLDRLLAEHHDDLAADVFVITDSTNWAVGRPAFTTTLRGMADCVVELATLDHAVHSGAFGGVVPDALTAMCRLLATLHDDQGNVAVAGLGTSEPSTLDYPEARLRVESGLLDGVAYLGSGSFVDRLWTKPAVTVIGIDATSVDQASNTLIPSVRARISLRVAPGDDAEVALEHVVAHLQAHAPWGARVTVGATESGQPARIDLSGSYAVAAQQAYATAWGIEPVEVGQGGSIPMVAAFAAAYPAATILVTAVGDPDSRPHGANESLHLGDFATACRAEALMLAAFADVESQT